MYTAASVSAYAYARTRACTHTAEALGSSPYELNVAPGPVCASRSTVSKNRGGASHWRCLSLATAGVATQFYVTARDAFDNRVAHHDADAGAAATERRLAAAAHGLTVRLVGVDAVAGFVRQSAPCDLEAGRDHGVS